MKIAIVGATGCGKSTFARALARGTGAVHAELDGLAWQDNWTETPDDELRARLERVLTNESWIIDGGFVRAWTREMVFGAADAIVWLDMPRRVVWSRLFVRTIRRAWTKERLWGTNNHESFRLSFLSRDSVLLWSIRTFGSRRRMYEELMGRGDGVAQKFKRAGSPSEADLLLAALLAEIDPAHQHRD